MSDPTEPASSSSGPVVPAGRRRRIRRWHVAVALVVVALLALATSGALLGASIALGLHRLEASSVRVGAPLDDELDTAADALGPPTAEWREQVALGWGEVRERPDEAADHFRRAILVDGERAEAWRGLGVALLSVDDVPGATDALCTAKLRGRRPSTALDAVLADEEIDCGTRAELAAPIRRARTPSP